MKITQCAPAAARITLAPEHQFPHAFPSPAATADGDGEMHSPYGLSYDDFSKMQIDVRKASAWRRSGVPDWSRNDASVRALLVAYFEHRAFGPIARKKNIDKPEAERLRLAVEKITASLPKRIETLDRLCREYCELHNSGCDPDRQRILKSEIEGLDATLRLCLGNGPATLLGVIYRSYRLCEDSVTVGAALALKPPSVRQILYRLNKIAAEVTAAA